MAFLYVFCAEYGIPEFIALTIIVNCLIGIKTPSAEMESGKQFLTVSGHFVSRNNSGIGARIHLRKGKTVTPENRFPLCGVIRFIGTASVGICQNLKAALQRLRVIGQKEITFIGGNVPISLISEP